MAFATAPAQHMRTIPKTGETLPAIGLGTWQTFDVGVSANDRIGPREVLKLFVEQGGRVIDSSPMNGESESVVGTLATELGVAKKLFLVTKVWIRGREEGVHQMEQSFRRMQTKRVDLMQIHNLLDWKTHLKTLRDWKAQGRIRYIGITHYTEGAYDDLAHIIETEDIDLAKLPELYGLATARHREAIVGFLAIPREKYPQRLMAVPSDSGRGCVFHVRLGRRRRRPPRRGRRGFGRGRLRPGARKRKGDPQEGRFAGPNAGQFVVSVEYPDLQAFAADDKQVAANAEYQAWLKGLDKVRKVVSDSYYEEAKP